MGKNYILLLIQVVPQITKLDFPGSQMQVVLPPSSIVALDLKLSSTEDQAAYPIKEMR